MSLNWVMLDGPQSFIRLPREKVLFTSPPRTALTLQTPNTFPGKEPLSIRSSDGRAIITNQRLIYLPATPTPSLQSFSSPLLSLHDTHTSAPFFGPNTWDATLVPIPAGGIPAHHTLVALKLTFKEGGAFDFHSTFERIKETLAQAMEVARESGRNTSVVDVDLEQLPPYEEAAAAAAGGQGVRIQRPVPIAPNGGGPRQAPAANNGVVGLRCEATARPAERDEGETMPEEPPPGYEEAQAGGGTAVEKGR